MAPAPDGQASELIARFRRARHDPTRAVLEGFHALMHAVRFHAEIEHACASDRSALEALTERLAPDVEPALRRLVRFVPPSVFAQLAPVPPDTGLRAAAEVLFAERAPRRPARSSTCAAPEVPLRPRHATRPASRPPRPPTVPGGPVETFR